MRKTIAALSIVVTANPTWCGELEDANKLFAYGEAQYPHFFAPAGAQTMSLLGYVARYYSDTATYLGVKDGWVYVYGDPFGGLVNVGAVDYYLGLIDGSGGQAGINLAGHWTGTGSSLAYPGCIGTLSVDLAQSGNTITGTGTLVGVCLDGPDSGMIGGTLSGNKITFGLAYDDSSEIYYEGELSADGSHLSGTYDWPDEGDHGIWSLNRQ
jgi:hypothetical protein